MTELINPNLPDYYQPKNYEELTKYQLFDVDQFIRQLKGPNLTNIIGSQSHLEDHLGKTIIEQLDSILDESQNRTYMSSINNRDLMRLVIREALTLHAEAIAVWAGVTGTAGVRRLSLDVSLPPVLWKDITANTESVGVGFDHNENIIAYQTYDYRVVLSRSEEDQHSPFGFGVYTVYPNIRSKDTQIAAIDIQPYIRNTARYQEGSPVEHAYLEHITELGQMIPLIRYGENDSHEFITLSLPSMGNDNVVCLLDDRKTTITKYDNSIDEDNKTNLSSIETIQYINKFPNYKSAIDTLRRNINTFLREDHQNN